jgi:hypothetical protein
MKTCRACGEPKPLDKFHRRSSAKDGLSATCKVCHNRQHTVYRRRIQGRGAGEQRYPMFTPGSSWRYTLDGVDKVIRVASVRSETQGYRVIASDGDRVWAWWLQKHGVPA